MKRTSTKSQTKSTSPVPSATVSDSQLPVVKSEPLVKSLDTSYVVSPVQQTPQDTQKPKRAAKKPVQKASSQSSESPPQVVSPPVKLEVSDTQVSPTLETVDGELLNVDEFDARCVEFYAKLQELTSSISTVRSEFKAIEKVWAKRIKTATKTSGKKKKKSGNRAPSGFVKPTKISDELASFLNKPTGTEMARTEVTREINQYIRANQLQDATNGRKINADQKLSTLLQLPAEDELTYFNLQKYMSVHFPKTPVV